MENGNQPITQDKSIGNSYINIVCVLKSGKEGYTDQYVDLLYSQVFRYLQRPFNFLCFTDMPFKPKVQGIQLIPIRNTGLKGWWAKIEAFRVKGAVIYFDLDTIIRGSLEPLVDAVLKAQDEYGGDPPFWMLQSFNAKMKWASGIMAWNGDYTQFLSTLTIEDMKNYRMDQKYIRVRCVNFGHEIKPINEFIKIYSFKHHCSQGVPEDAGIICFHGHPRPHEVGGQFFDKSQITQETVMEGSNA